MPKTQAKAAGTANPRRQRLELKAMKAQPQPPIRCRPPEEALELPRLQSRCFFKQQTPLTRESTLSGRLGLDEPKAVE